MTDPPAIDNSIISLCVCVCWVTIILHFCVLSVKWTAVEKNRGTHEPSPNKSHPNLEWSDQAENNIIFCVCFNGFSSDTQSLIELSSRPCVKSTNQWAVIMTLCCKNKINEMKWAMECNVSAKLENFSLHDFTMLQRRAAQWLISNALWRAYAHGCAKRMPDDQKIHWCKLAGFRNRYSWRNATFGYHTHTQQQPAASSSIGQETITDRRPISRQNSTKSFLRWSSIRAIAFARACTAHTCPTHTHSTQHTGGAVAACARDANWYVIERARARDRPFAHYSRWPEHGVFEKALRTRTFSYKNDDGKRRAVIKVCHIASHTLHTQDTAHATRTERRRRTEFCGRLIRECREFKRYIRTSALIDWAILFNGPSRVAVVPR